jgi:hypothetical protein
MSYSYSPLHYKPDGEQYFTIQDNTQPNNIIMNVGTTEMLKVAPDGFYVRGVKVTQDDKEAETVYNAFKAFLVWAELNRR